MVPKAFLERSEPMYYKTVDTSITRSHRTHRIHITLLYTELRQNTEFRNYRLAYLLENTVDTQVTLRVRHAESIKQSLDAQVTQNFIHTELTNHMEYCGSVTQKVYSLICNEPKLVLIFQFLVPALF